MQFSLNSLVSILLLGHFAAANVHGANALNTAERPNEKRTLGTPAAPQPHLRKQTSSFYSNKTKPFWVEGTGLPDVPFDVGESYAGLLPISDNPAETRKLFFWFFPTTNPNATKDITLWFNGGPGCSSLIGLLQENGPFTWEAGTLGPVPNSYSWTNLTNMLWIEQPVGVGFSQGVPNITNEVELALELTGFYKSFVDTFDVHKYDVYLTGESYAGYYVPYIADAFITANDTDYYNLKGIAINDPLIGDQVNQEQVVMLPYVNYWQNLLYLNQTFLDQINKQAEVCNFNSYLDKYLTYPPPQESFPVLPRISIFADNDCDIFDAVYYAVTEQNPCFNIYHITETCPTPYSILGVVNQGDDKLSDLQVYFNRSDVQAAINAPPTNWMICTDVNVFANQSTRSDIWWASDQSVGPALNGVLQRVIEYTNNTIIGSGNLDMLLNTNGTLLAIQNVTWHGLQGFQSYPGKPFYAPYHPEYNSGSLSGSGTVGLWGSERGLTFYQVQLAGHEVPGYAPGAAYRALEYLLGRVKSLDESAGGFTTQIQGNPTTSAPRYKVFEKKFLFGKGGRGGKGGRRGIN